MAVALGCTFGTRGESQGLRSNLQLNPSIVSHGNRVPRSTITVALKKKNCDLSFSLDVEETFSMLSTPARIKKGRRLLHSALLRVSLCTSFKCRLNRPNESRYRVLYKFAF